jgi:hypothetical protein
MNDHIIFFFKRHASIGTVVLPPGSHMGVNMVRGEGGRKAAMILERDCTRVTQQVPTAEEPYVLL